MTARAAGRYFLTGEKFGADEAARHRAGHHRRRRRRRRRSSALTADDREGLAAGAGRVEGADHGARFWTAFDRHAEELTEQSARLFVSDEAREGMLAFLQKRPPRWVS